DPGVPRSSRCAPAAPPADRGPPAGARRTSRPAPRRKLDRDAKPGQLFPRPPIGELGAGFLDEIGKGGCQSVENVGGGGRPKRPEKLLPCGHVVSPCK